MLYKNKRILPSIISKAKTEKYYWDALELLKKEFIYLIESAKKNTKTALIWISTVWDYSLLREISPIIMELKEENSNVIFSIGWSDFIKATDKEFLEMVHWLWFDIINIGWAKEYLEVMKNKDNFFYRTSDNKLKCNKQIPDNILLSWEDIDLSKITIGQHIETTYNINEWVHLNFMIQSMWCYHSCGHCVKDLNRNNTPNNEDIDISIKKANEYIKMYRKLYLSSEKKWQFSIENLNPFQYRNKFLRFIKNIDLSDFEQVLFWWDFIWLWNDRGSYKTMLETISYLKETYPDIKIHLSFSYDALHKENDWDFSLKMNWNKLSTEEELQKAINRLYEFACMYENDERVGIRHNTMINPAMDIDLYIDRYNTLQKIDTKTKSDYSIYTLEPTINSEVAEKYRGHYIAPYKASENEIVREYFSKSVTLPYWWYFYMNSCLLDCHTYVKLLGHSFFHILDTSKEELTNNYNESKQSLFFKMLDFWLYVVNKHKEDNNEKKANKTKRDSINYIDFMIFRENHMIENWKNYPKVKTRDFIIKLQEYKLKFINE